MKAYVPKRGDFITVAFDPQAGHEQMGLRPALVVSHTLFNKQTGLAMVCPLTRTQRDYPFHVAVKEIPNVKGFVMVEQIKSIDYRARRARPIGKASDDILDEVLAILDACIY